MLTVFNQPIQAPDRGERVDRTREAELAAIAAEIAARIEEMETLKLMSGGGFIAKLAAVRAISPLAFRVCTQMLSGDSTRMQSYAEQAARRGISRQTVFLEFRNELAKVRHLFPALVDMLDSIHASALASEDRQNNADSIREVS